MFQDYFKKSVSLLLVLTVGMTQGVSASTIQALSFSPQKNEISEIEKNMPLQLGRVDETHFGKNSKTVVLIQDAHGSLSVQQSIRELIAHLNHNYAMRLLMLEGAAQELEPDLYRFYDDPSLSRMVGERLFERGELTGAEMFLLDHAIDDKCSSNCAVGMGMEEAADYARDLRLFREIITNNDKIESFLVELVLAFEKQASRVLSKDLLGFLKAFAFAERTNSLFSADYLSSLKEQVNQTLRIDLESPQEQFQYPMLVRYFRLRLMESRIDPEKADDQKARLIDWLRQNKASQQLVDKIQALTAQTRGIRSLLEELVREMESRGFDFAVYPDLTRWAGFHALMQEIEPEAMMRETESAVWAVALAMAKQADEKELLKTFRRIIALTKILRLELSREEWKKVVQKQSALRPTKFAAELKGGTVHPGIEKVFDKALDFYMTAEAREKHFIANLENQMQATGQKYAVMVAGGFHKQGILEKLKSAGYSFASVMPHAGGLDISEAKKTYRRTMLETSQVQQLLRMIDLEKAPAAMAGLGDLDYRLAEAQAATSGISGEVRPGTVFYLQPALSNDRQLALVRSEFRLAESVQKYFSLKKDLMDAADAEDKERAMKLWDELETSVLELQSNRSKWDSQQLNAVLREFMNQPQASDDDLMFLRREIESAAGYGIICRSCCLII